MTELGTGLTAANHYEDALSVQEAELSIQRRVGAHEHNILVTQNSLTITYDRLGRRESVLRMRRDVYSGFLKLYGKEHGETIRSAFNYADSLRQLKRFEEAKTLMRKMIPVARRVLGEEHSVTLTMKAIYADALYMDPGATLDDLREAVTTGENTERIARRVMGGAHPNVGSMEESLQQARATLRRRETSRSA